MQRKNMEWSTFLKLCGTRDRALLMGEQKMSFADFLRLSYITDFFGFSQINREFWTRFSNQFTQRLNEIRRIVEESEFEMEQLEVEEEAREREEWIEAFINQSPDAKFRKYLEKAMLSKAL
ncbi:MAG: hypothetical protein ACI4F1_10650 [Bariatricus sp.]